MSKLKAAIRVLEYVLSAESRNARESSKAAIRVLKAAEKVDKANALESLRDATENGEGGTENYIRGLVESRALLEALPDKEGKG